VSFIVAQLQYVFLLGGPMAAHTFAPSTAKRSHRNLGRIQPAWRFIGKSQDTDLARLKRLSFRPVVPIRLRLAFIGGSCLGRHRDIIEYWQRDSRQCAE